MGDGAEQALGDLDLVLQRGPHGSLQLRGHVDGRRGKVQTSGRLRRTLLGSSGNGESLISLKKGWPGPGYCFNEIGYIKAFFGQAVSNEIKLLRGQGIF